MIEKEGWDEEETTEMKRGIDSGWEEGIISHRGSVQWGSIIHYMCYMQWSMWWEESERGKLQQHHWSSITEAALQSNSTRGSLQLMKRAALLFKTDAARFRLQCQIFPMTFERVNWNKSSSMWAFQGEHNHHLDNHLQLCNVFHFKSTQWFVGRRRGRWVSSTSFHAVTLWTYGIWATKHGGDYILQYSLPHVHIIHPRDVNYGTSLCFFPASIIKT